MQHTIVSKEYIGSRQWQVVVDMRPATPAETKKELVADYLSFSLAELGNYSIVRLDIQQGNRATIIIFQN